MDMYFHSKGTEHPDLDELEEVGAFIAVRTDEDEYILAWPSYAFAAGRMAMVLSM